MPDEFSNHSSRKEEMAPFLLTLGFAFDRDDPRQGDSGPGSLHRVIVRRIERIRSLEAQKDGENFLDRED